MNPAPVTPEELAALLPSTPLPKSAVVVGREPELAAACSALDAKTPGASIELGGMFRGALRRRVEAKFTDASSRSAEEIAQTAPVLIVMRKAPATGTGVIAMSCGGARALVAMALGAKAGGAPEVDDGKPLTHVERQVLVRAVRRLVDVISLSLGVSGLELGEVIDDLRGSVLERHRRLACAELTLTGDVEATLHMALPGTWLASVPVRARTPRRISPAHIVLDVQVELGRVHLPLSKLLSLRVGDVLVLPTPEGAPLPLSVGGRAICLATPSLNAGPLELRVTATPTAPRTTAGNPPARRVLSP